MNHILQEHISDLQLVQYSVLPLDSTQGFIEIVEHSQTIQEIQNNKFSIQNYILEHNPQLTIHEIRNRFTKSCAVYCVISYLLGIGDRHLDNIMITQSGYLFHIDFSFILGYTAKMLSPEIKITPDMIDAMGGDKSIYFTLFKDTCKQSFTQLRRHTNIFLSMLLMLSRYCPSIDNHKYTKEYIENQVLLRFMPGENNEQAELRFITKFDKNRKSTYSNMLLDYCHKKTQDNSLLSTISHFFSS